VGDGAGPPDGTRRREEVFLLDYPWTRRPPAGTPATSYERVAALGATTLHLL
jgi:hypothetical protein